MGAPPPTGLSTDAATGEHGDLLDLIRHRLGATSLDPVLEEARAILSLPPAPSRVPHPPPTSSAERTAAADRLWGACRPLAGTHAGAYLRARGLAPDEVPALRFHPALHYRDGTRSEQLPALVAAVTTSEGELAGIHRTWLDPRAPVKARVTEPKKALRPIHGHAVRFAVTSRSRSLFVVAENIETVLAVLTAVPWLSGAAALSAPGLASFTPPPPPGLERLLIGATTTPLVKTPPDALRAGVESSASPSRCSCPNVEISTTSSAPSDRPPWPSASRRVSTLAQGPPVAAPRRIHGEGDGDDARDQDTSTRAVRDTSPHPEPAHPIRSNPMPDTTHTTHSTPTYTRLRSGVWGVRVPEAVHPLAPGERARVAVHRRSGVVSSETVRCFWRGVSSGTDEVVALCEIVPTDADAFECEDACEST